MTEFHKTSTGKKFYETDFPNLVTQMKRIADSLDTLVKEHGKVSAEEKKKIALERKNLNLEIAAKIDEQRKAQETPAPDKGT